MPRALNGAIATTQTPGPLAVIVTIHVNRVTQVFQG